MRHPRRLAAVFVLAALPLACTDALPETTTQSPTPPGAIGTVETVALDGPSDVSPLDVGDVDDRDLTTSDDATSDVVTVDDLSAADGGDAADVDDTVDADDGDLATADDIEVEVDMGPPTYASCQAAYDAGETASGLRLIEVGGELHEAYCEQERGGTTGWTLVAKLTVIGEQVDEGPWRPDASPNLWESDGIAEFGTNDITVNEDYRSPLFHLLPATAIRITRNDAFVVHTGNDCLDGRPLAQVFREATWGCYQSQHTSYADCSISCPLNVGDPNDQVFGDGVVAIDTLYLKAGEADDADVGYTDRTYVATNFLDVGFPHQVGGLGGHCFGANCGGSYDVAAKGDNPQRPDENTVWAIYVR